MKTMSTTPMTAAVPTRASATPLFPAMKPTLLALAVTFLLSGCYSTAIRPVDRDRHPDGVPSKALDFVPTPKTAPPPLPMAQRQDDNAAAAEDAFSPGKRYSFKAQGAPLRQALAQFAQAFKLNIVADQDAGGVVTVDVANLPLEQTLDIILDPAGLGWWRDGSVVHVSRKVTRNYIVDYPRLTRTGSSSSSGSAGGSSGSVSSTDSMNFWGELEKEIKDIMKIPFDGTLMSETTTSSGNTTAGNMSNLMVNGANALLNNNARSQTTTRQVPIEKFDGSLVINKSTGMVQVTTSPKSLRQIDLYMKHLMSRMNKQVYIEVRIMEVSLRNDNSFGIDWSKVVPPAPAANAVGGATAILPLSSSGSLSTLAPTINLTAMPFNGQAVLHDVVAAISALEAQGDVKVVSQPRIRTLNNQPAIIKTGTERTFFTQKTTITKGTNGAADTREITDEAQAAIDGLMLTVVPQIGSDNVISLDVTPSMTKIVGETVAKSLLSSAPITETNQMTTLVRVNDGETAVIGGMIIEEESETARQVPGIGDAPLAGWLFKGKYNNRLRKELVIFITPHVISN
jgi:MSHA type pilus biogenesis protein MshL